MSQSEPKPEVRYVSTSEVSAALGVSVTTVKRWVDDGILPAHKTAGGHRKLLYSDVVRLARDGPLPQADLTRLESPRPRRTPRPADELVERLTSALRTGDQLQIRSVLLGAYHAGLPIDQLADTVLAPAMARIGHEWEAGRIDVLHEHRGTQLVAATLYELKAIVDRQAERERPIAVGGAIEQDQYLLPSLLAQTALLDQGWNAVNLGPNTPFHSFRKAVEEYGPKLMWISVSYLPDVEKFEKEYREFYREAERQGVAVAIGGHALPRDVRARIPYTAHGDGLGHLVAFARTLHVRPKPPKRGRPARVQSI
ncbi:MAG: B12-binding domain-containing protein [Gemmataceae bacterium]|nr:B12-binding domain-containing protein [Gemmataceae bacterium]